MIELLRTRRSIRKYTSRPVEPDKVALLEEAVLRAPSSHGRKPWQFVFVTDPALLTELSRTKSHGSSFLGGATLAIVVCGDEQQCDVWVEDCSITAFIAHVAAHSLGLGSCLCERLVDGDQPDVQNLNQCHSAASRAARHSRDRSSRARSPEGTQP